MRYAAIGLSTGFALVLLVFCLIADPQAQAQNPVTSQPVHSRVTRMPHTGNAAPAMAQAIKSEGMIAIPSSSNESMQQLTLIDPNTRMMSVYHIDKITGRISLKSVRNIYWDMQMEELNAERPSPREIRSMVQPR